MPSASAMQPRVGVKGIFKPSRFATVRAVTTERRPLPWVEYTELTALFLIQGAAMGMWLVPLSTVLDAHGQQAIKPFAFAASAVAAFISPLFFGAMADRQTSPIKILRWLSVATAASMALASLAIQCGWSPWLVLAFIQLHALCSSPTWSIASSVVFSRLRDAKREFGPIRAVATLGWMAGCWLVSALNADASPRAGYNGALTWLVVTAFTFLLPEVNAPQVTGKTTLRERLGLDALTLLKNHDHRVVFITAALFNIPLAAFYPYTPPHLKELGLGHTTAWMTLGQVTEIFAMLFLARLLTNWRLKWILATGLGFGVLRFVLSALDAKTWILLGIALHGCSFTLVFITAQIYLDQCVDPAWRTRAQALMSLMTSGVGNLIGYLGVGAWFTANARPAGENWPVFWSGLAVSVAAVLAYFLLAYQGKGARPAITKSVTAPAS
ncbi:MAG: MFS transporter [Verrucomicrobia bacterium]|nr:MFS transporter [Verrucomicrobiota bacterium]